MGFPHRAARLLRLVRLLSSALLVFACARRAAPDGVFVDRAACVIADTLAPSPDTVRVLGTGDAQDRAPSSRFDCARRPIRFAGAPTVVTLRLPPRTDLRDLLDGRLASRGMATPDVVVTRDEMVIDFARRHPGYFVDTLPWLTSHLLVTRLGGSQAIPTDPERDALAREAVTAEARGALGPFPWLTIDRCSLVVPPSSVTPPPRLAYTSGDAIARNVAERIVSLAGAHDRPLWLPIALTQVAAGALRVTPVPADSLVGALAAGRVAAAVLSVSRDPTTTCSTRNNDPLPAGAIPLVDSRAHVIVRRGSGAAFLVGADGELHFLNRGNR